MVNIYAKPWLPSAKRPLEFHENSEKFQIQINGDQFGPRKLKVNFHNLYLCLHYTHLFQFLGDMILGDCLALIGPYIKSKKNQ